MEKPLTPIDFIANMINQQQSIQDGYSCGVRWLCLRKDLKEKYLSMAQHAYDSWIADELAMKQERDSLTTETNN